MKAFASLAQAASAPKALDGKMKELIALGIAVAVRCDDCIGFHVKAALKQGASRNEVLETLGMAIYMGAGPSAMYATHALEAFAQFEQPQGAAIGAAGGGPIDSDPSELHHANPLAARSSILGR